MSITISIPSLHHHLCRAQAAGLRLRTGSWFYANYDADNTDMARPGGLEGCSACLVGSMAAMNIVPTAHALSVLDSQLTTNWRFADTVAFFVQRLGLAAEEVTGLSDAWEYRVRDTSEAGRNYNTRWSWVFRHHMPTGFVYLIRDRHAESDWYRYWRTYWVAWLAIALWDGSDEDIQADWLPDIGTILEHIPGYNRITVDFQKEVCREQYALVRQEYFATNLALV